MGIVEDRVIYVRGNGFLTESGEWSNDIVDARLFSVVEARNYAATFSHDKPVILTWN